MTGAHVAGDLGAYLAGALDRREDRAIATHLLGCARCSAEMAGLAPTAAALARVPPELLLDGPPDGGDLLLRRAVRRVRREGRAPLRRVGVALVLAAACATGGFAVAAVTVRPVVVASAPASAPPAAIPGALTGSATDPATGAAMAVVVVPASGWVRLSATVSGIAAGERCRLVVVGADGSREPAGTWLVPASGEGDGTALDGSALVGPLGVRAVEVETDQGRRLVSVAL